MRVLDKTARRILDRLELHVRPGSTATRQGGHRSPVLASGVEFADHRPYVPGDDFRRIDWRAFHRHGQLVLRQFEEERDARVYVLLDLSGSMSRGKPPKIEVAKRVAAAFAYVGMKQFDRAVILPFGADLEREARPLRVPSDLPDVDAFIASASAGGPTAFDQAIRSFALRFPDRGLAVVVTDLMSPAGFPEGFRAIGALGHELRVVAMRCGEDEAPDVQGELELHDAETGRTVRLRITRDVLAAYAKELQRHREACRDATRRAGGRFLELDVTLPLEEQFRAIFRGEER